MTPDPRATYVHFRMEYNMKAKFVALMDCFLLSLVKKANCIHISSGRLPYLMLLTVNIPLFTLPGFLPSQNEVKYTALQIVVLNTLAINAENVSTDNVSAELTGQFKPLFVHFWFHRRMTWYLTPEEHSSRPPARAQHGWRWPVQVWRAMGPDRATW